MTLKIFSTSGSSLPQKKVPHRSIMAITAMKPIQNLISCVLRSQRLGILTTRLGCAQISSPIVHDIFLISLLAQRQYARFTTRHIFDKLLKLWLQ